MKCAFKRVTVLPIALLVLFFTISSLSFIGCSSDTNKISIELTTPNGPSERQTNIIIEFSEDIVGEEQVQVLLDSIEVFISPKLPARYRWITTKTLQIMPLQPLNPATRYSLIVKPEILKDAEKSLARNRVFEFETKRFKVVSIVPTVESLVDDPKYVSVSVGIRFSELVELEEFKKYLILKWRNRSTRDRIDYKIIGGEISDVYTLKLSPIKRDQKVKYLDFGVEEGLQAKNSNMPLSESKTRKVGIEASRELVVKYVKVVQRGMKHTIVADFSTSVRLKNIKSYILLSEDINIDVTQEAAGRLVITGEFTAHDQMTIKFLKGLKSKDGGILEDEFYQALRFPDLKPSLRFGSKGSYLSRHGLKNIKIEALNMNKLHVEVEKVYINNLVTFLHTSYNRRGSSIPVGKRVFEKDVEFKTVKNRLTPFTVDFENLLKNHNQGLFRFTIRGDGRYWRADTRSIMITDIGMIAKQAEDKLHIWTISTSSLNELVGTKVKLLSQTNQIISEGYTDNNGHITLRGMKKNSDDFIPFVITAERGDDFSFLLFSECKISTSNFEVNGKSNSSKGFDAFLYSDRGVYRPGEKVNVVAVVRDKKLKVPTDLPVVLKVLGPDGENFEELRGKLNVQGMAEFTVDIPSYSRTGKYRARLEISGPSFVGETSFSIEEFLPDRIKVDVSTDKNSYVAGDSIAITVDAKLLFGMPANDRRYEIRSWFEPHQFRPLGWKDYSFSNLTGSLGDVEKTIGSGKLDSNGKAILTYDIPKGIRPVSAAKAVVEVSVFEHGGRSVSKRTSTIVHPNSFYLGVDRISNKYGAVDKSEEFNWVAVSSDGKEIDIEGIVARISKIGWRSVVELDASGRRRYVSHKHHELVKEIFLDNGSQGSFEFNPDHYGQYQVDIVHRELNIITSTQFHVSGWGYSPWSMQNPDRIELEMGKPAYKPNEQAEVVVKAPFSGKLLITVEREKVFYSKLYDLDGTTATIKIPIKKAYGPNAYVTATLVRSPQVSDEYTPLRAYGAIPVFMDMSDKDIDVSVLANRKVRPNEKLDITVKVPNAGSQAFVTIAAIDEGILQLTEYENPNLHSFFFTKKRLDITSYDIFNLLLPEVERAKLFSSPGGDRDSRRRSHLTSRSMSRVKPVALWSGLLPVKNGRVKYSIDLPEFNGQLRVVAVAVSGDKFGVGDLDVTVQAPIVLTPSVPRFASGKDNFIIPVSVFLTEKKAQDVKVSLNVNGPIEIIGESTESIHLESMTEDIVRFELNIKDADALAHLKFTATSDDYSAKSEVNLPIRPPTAPMSITGNGTVKPNKAVNIDVPADFIVGTANFFFAASSTPKLEFAKSLNYLLRYPHGCLEQTTSKAIPLLYFDTIVKQIDPTKFEDHAAEYYVSQAIKKISSMQSPQGHFSFWPRGRGTKPWASTYALHFLAEAKKLGYHVPENVTERGVFFLKDVVRSKANGYNSRSSRNQNRNWRNGETWDKGDEQTIQTYAMYVLALLGDPDQGKMNYLFEEKFDELSYEARVLLGGAFSLSGDNLTANKLWPEKLPAENPNENRYGRIFNSRVRRLAVTLTVMSDTAPDHYLIPKLTKTLNELYNEKRWLNTQENAWALLAMGKLIATSKAGSYTAKIENNGNVIADFDNRDFSFSDSTLLNTQLNLSTVGETNCYYFWEARGLPVKYDFNEVNEGINVKRRILTSEGDMLSLENANQGELYVVEITISSKDKVENVVIDDLLPAGFEIENPRLDSRASFQAIPEGDLSPQASDIRDDRLLLYVDLQAGAEKNYYYLVRAVTEGTFVIPPITAESMYDPTIRGSGSSGFLTVVKR
jgi:alpha-2-macroglobulin